MKKFELSHKNKTGISIIILIIGAIIISGLISHVQTNTSREQQRINSVNALNEIALTIENNDKTIEGVTYEFNKLNTDTTQSLSEYAYSTHLLETIFESSPSEKPEKIKKACDDIYALQNDLGTDTIGVVDTDGNIILCSNYDYILENKNLSTFVDRENDFYKLFRYDEELGINGTEAYDKNTDAYSFSPVTFERNGIDLGMYSTRLLEYDGVEYYLLLTFHLDLLDLELKGISDISDVLSGLTIGTDGFFFALDTETGKFAYYDHDQTPLTGEEYGKHGFTASAATDGYTGYQTIDGTKYYCVAKSSNSQTYGRYLIVCAAISQSALIGKNILTIVISCVTFILAACIIYGYGMILEKDKSKHYIFTENRFKDQIRNSKIDDKGTFTEEEVNERTHILMEDLIEKNTDKKLKRINIGFRSKDGKQRFFTPHIFLNLVPLIAIGMIAIFGIVFASQTLLMVQDATQISTSKLNEIGELIIEANNTSQNISESVSSQYLAKDKLISYLLSNDVEKYFSYDEQDDNTHRLYKKDEDGNRIYLSDEFGNPRYSQAVSPLLQEICKHNDISVINVYDYEGNVILTNTTDWFFALSQNENDQSYDFRRIIDGHANNYIQEYRVNEAGEKNQYVGTVFNYYTYSKNNCTYHTTKEAYDKYIDGDTSLGEVKKLRGLVQIGINQSTLENIYKISTLDYILSDISVYGDESFFVAFDDSEEHEIVYCPNSQLVGKSAGEFGISGNAFSLTSEYNGFNTINGIKYYQTFKFVDGYYIATAIPENELYHSRVNISFLTLGLSILFIVAGTTFFTISNDKLEERYRKAISSEGKMLAKPVGFTISSPNGKKKKTVTASSRYIRVSWDRKTVEQKLGTIMTIYLTIASFLFFGIMIYALSTADTTSIFPYIFRGNWDRGMNAFAVAKAIMIVVMVITVTKIARFFVKTCGASLGARAETTGNLIVSFLQYGGILGGLFYSLYLFGLDTGSLITSAGILSVVVGLGAQSLIGDILAGMFIVFEGEFRVGDIVTIGDFRGQVIEIGLRTTKLIDVANNVKVFNNSTISSVLNMTKDHSVASIDVSIEYGEDLERVEKVLLEGFDIIRSKIPTIIGGPNYLGVSELADSAVKIKIVANCEEKDRLQVARDLNREIFLLFKAHNINIPFNQLTLSYLPSEGGNKDE